MKQLLPKGLALLIALLMPLGMVAPAYAQEEELKYMAYNFYSNPDLSGTSKRFDSFMIDFRSDKTPLTTYWALANFGMDLNSPKTRRTYPGIQGFGAYAGLQHSNKKMGILSFWEAAYSQKGETLKLTATRVYPDGSSSFGGEGEGTNCIKPYEWETGSWYRMLLHSWEDSQTGTTFAGMWLLDVETGNWTLFAYFDTHLYDSFFTGAMSQFMENYWGTDVTTNCNVERTCNLKNMYVFDHVKKDWVSLPTATLSYGDGNPVHESQKKYGAHTFGATEEYFWGSTGGKVEDQEAYEQAATKHSTHTINQPEKPTLGAPAIEKLRLGKNITWELAPTSTPQLSYSVQVVDAQGTVLLEKQATRPEIRTEELGTLSTDAYKCIVTVTDVFGTETKSEIATDAYKELVKDEPTPENSPEPEDSSSQSSSNSTPEEPTEEKGGFFAQLGDFFKGIFDAVSDFFKKLFGIED
jgi:hypothetical protein